MINEVTAILAWILGFCFGFVFGLIVILSDKDYVSVNEICNHKHYDFCEEVTPTKTYKMELKNESSLRY